MRYFKCDECDFVSYDERYSNLDKCPKCRGYLFEKREPVGIDTSKWTDGKWRFTGWMFDAAPEELKEYWLIVAPTDLYIGWIDKIGHCDVSEHPTKDGSTIYIGAHS